MAQVIKSLENPIIKEASSLKQKKYRKLLNLAILEGHKIIDEGINSKLEFVNLFIDENKKDTYSKYAHLIKCNIIYTDERVLKAISPSDTPQGILATVKTKYLTPMVIDNNNFLVLEHIQDPGNVGAIIRSAAASNFKNIFMIDCVDVYNDKVVRASMGNLFKVNCYDISLEKLQKLLSVKENYELYLADMNGKNIFQLDLPKNKVIGIIIGNEGSGVTENIKKLATQTISIPMQNGVESLNAAVSASILMYKMNY
ncbi:MAG: TrmH family RNA methyltransferase [Spirochaetales bacterium]